MAGIRGNVFDIQKFSIHDGPGIRTTVFLKGCPLNCLWCHNPESKSGDPEISFISNKCILCGYCVSVCMNKCHSIAGGLHIYDRSECLRCGSCTSTCYAKALEMVGKQMGIKEVIEEVLKDMPFYETSGGGMTISGGEPMMQFEFTKALLEEAKKSGLHNCLETSGFATTNKFVQIMPSVDIFLYDFKESDPGRHKKFTGVWLKPILENLMELDRCGAKTALRCPIIPELNDRSSHFKEIANLANKLVNLIEVDILAYHLLGKSKSRRIGKEYPLDNKKLPEEAEVNTWIDAIQGMTNKTVKRG